MANKSRRLRRLASKLTLALVSAIVTLALLEIALRLVYPQGGQPQLFEFDPELGHRNKPDVDLLHVWDARENVSRIRTDSRGFRTTGVAGNAADFRILMLGDSYTFGYGVGDDSTFSAVLESNWNQHRPATIQVINAGVSAYGTAQEMLLYEIFARKEPVDLVVLNVFVGNDVQDNSCLELGSLLPHRRAPCFEVRDGDLVQESAPLPPGSRGRAKTSIWTRARQWPRKTELYGIVSQRAIGHLQGSPRAVAFLASLGLDLNPGYLPHVVGGWYLGDRSQRGWELTRTLISRLAAAVRSTGAEFAVILIPSRVQVLPELSEVSSVLYPQAREMEAFFANPGLPQQLLVDHLSSSAIPVLDLMPIFQQQDQVSDHYYPVIAHWNERGHELVAGEIEQFLLRHDLVSTSAGPHATSLP